MTTGRIAHLVSLWRNLVHRSRVDRDLDEELRVTVDLLIDENVRSGMRPDDARRAARLELGSPEALKDRVRDARAGAALATVAQDIRYALRRSSRRRLCGGSTRDPVRRRERAGRAGSSHSRPSSDHRVSHPRGRASRVDPVVALLHE